jgi:eukaryotic-like serine/threonine-protein kinase
MGLPPALRPRYMVLRELPNPGAEADVLLVRDADTDLNAAAADLKVVKVYRRGMHADHAVWAKVQSLSSRNIVRFVATGTSGGRDYEVMEYLPGGNLTQLFRGSRGLPLSTVTEVVRQVAGGLAELHSMGIVHRDLKPENVLVRDTQPVDVVVTDFGLSRVPEQSVVAASRTGTLAYLSPETLLSKGAHSSKARDWWALGMIARELLTGVRPFEEMTESAIHQALLLRPVDLGDIDDPRARLLCRGLLLRDPSDRWEAWQVREWLAGGTPPVAEESVAESGGIKAFVFERVQYRERKALARAFVRSWNEAARRFFVAMGTASATSSSWRALQEWLEQFVDAEADDVEGLYQMIDDQLLSPTKAPDVKLLTLIQWLDPSLTPVYRGQSLDRENLAALAERMAIDPAPDAEFKRIVTDLHKYNLLPQLARMRGGAGLTELNARWRELDDRFRQQAHGYARGLTEDARQLLADADNFRRQAALLFLALDPAAHAVKLEQHTTRAAGLLPAPVPWFDQIHADALNNSNPVGHVLLVTLYPLAARESAAADQARRQHEDAIRRSEAHWAEHERQRLAGAPGLPRAIAYSCIIAGVMLIMFIATVANVHSVANDIGSGLAGVVVAGLIFATEGNLAQQLGSDYTYYRPTEGWGRRMRRAGSHVHGAGRGCLFLVVLLFGVPFLIGLAITVPFVVYAIIGVQQLRSWTRRRKAWQVQHEQQRAQILGRVA